MVLLEELVEEVLLRLPPADPVSLYHAALVCKTWCRIISNRRFRRRFSEFHRSPPMLGLLCNFRDQDRDYASRLHPTSSDYVSRLHPTSSACPLRTDQVNRRVLDARHGRVLLSLRNSCIHLSVWDPITDVWHQLPKVSDARQLVCWNAAVLCASTASGACDHIDCRSGPFIVVAVGVRSPSEMCLCVYSSDSTFWSELAYVPGTRYFDLVPPTLVGNALYFRTDFGHTTLRYDLATRETSVIPLPANSDWNNTVKMAMADDRVKVDRVKAVIGLATRSYWRDTTLMTTEDGGLGAAIGHSAGILSLWSMEANPTGDTVWTRIRDIDFGKLLNVNPLSISSKFFGFADGIGVFFAEADGKLFGIELKSGQVKMLCQGSGFHHVFPYSSWCTLALKAAAVSTGEEPTTGASSASEA